MNQLGKIAWESKVAAIEAQLISLRARRAAAINFSLSMSMQNEVTLLDAQIKALESELTELRKNQ